MERVFFRVKLDCDTEQINFTSSNRISFESLDDLKRFLNNPSDFWNREDVERFYRDVVCISESDYYVDEDGNELDISEIDPDDLLNYDIKFRTEEELDKMLSDKMNEYDEYVDAIKKGNYQIDSLDILNTRTWKYDDIKESIVLLKDQVKYINLERLSLDEITDLVNTVDISDDVSLKTRFNYRDTCKCSELKELLDYLNNIKNYIDRFNLSPLEICIFVNDLLREREYNENDDELEFRPGMTEEEIKEVMDSTADSRSIIRVFKSDKIVCAGFSNLYSAILELVGIKCDNVSYIPTADKSDNYGHMSNLVYLNDDFYDIHDIFEVDTTWGRKRNRDKSYNYQKSIYNYFNFMRPLRDAKRIKLHKQLEYNSPGLLINIIGPTIERAFKLVEMGAPSTIMQNDTQIIINKCEQLRKIMGEEYLENEIKKLSDIRDRYGRMEPVDSKEFLNVLRRVYTKVYYPGLNPFAFRKALYNVKLIEHSIDKDKYPFNVTDFNKAFKSRMNGSESQLLLALYGDSGNIRMNQERKLDVARMELLSVLHKATNDNVDKNPVHHV